MSEMEEAHIQQGTIQGANEYNTYKTVSVIVHSAFVSFCKQIVLKSLRVMDGFSLLRTIYLETEYNTT